MVLCCLFECGLSAHTLTHKERGTAHRHVCVVCCVCDGVVWWWVRVWGDELWHGGLKWGKDGVKDTVTQKQKDALFPQTTFPLLFPSFLFPQLFPYLTLSCCATIRIL